MTREFIIFDFFNNDTEKNIKSGEKKTVNREEIDYDMSIALFQNYIFLNMISRKNLFK